MQSYMHHMSKKQTPAECPDCGTGEEETTEHLFNCPAASEKRLQIFGSYHVPLTVLRTETDKVLQYLRARDRLSSTPSMQQGLPSETEHTRSRTGKQMDDPTSANSIRTEQHSTPTARPAQEPAQESTSTKGTGEEIHTTQLQPPDDLYCSPRWSCADAEEEVLTPQQQPPDNIPSHTLTKEPTSPQTAPPPSHKPRAPKHKHKRQETEEQQPAPHNGKRQRARPTTRKQC